MVKLTISVLSTIPDAQPLVCSATVTASDGSFQHSYTETASTTAARSGSAASCVMTIPYLWRLGSGPTYTISYQIIADSGTSFPTRYAQYNNNVPVPVPVSGSTSGRNFTVHV